MESNRPQGFPGTHRLRYSREFLRTRRFGKKYQTPHFILYCLLKDDGATRLGLTVSRKVGNAVRRNHIKRLLREFFRQHRSLLPPHADLSFIAKKGAAGVSYQQICTEILQALHSGRGGHRHDP